MVDLICEGACNPWLPTFETAADEYAKFMRNEYFGPESPEAAHWLERVRECRQRLVHTPHRHRYGEYWACSVCRAERRYPAPMVAA